MPQEIKDHHEKQSQTLKQALTMDPIMRHPDFTKKFILLCGASNVAIGGVLAQESKDDKTLLHPIIFFGSKALSMAERKISTYDEKEFLAIVYFVQFYRQYLLENHFIICTDQKSWQYRVKFNDDDAATKIVRWQAPLLGYDFDIIYKAVKELRKEPEDGLEVDNRNVKKEKLAEDELQTSQIVEDAGMKQKYYDALLKYLTLWKYPEEYGEKSRKSLRHVARLYCVNEGKLYKKATKEDEVDRQVIPTKQVVQILRECDDHILSGHQGIKATYQRVKQQYCWPGYYDTVREYVHSCKLCQGFGIANTKIPLHIVENRVEGAFAKIGIDYIYTPKTSQGHNGALVIINYLTAWTTTSGGERRAGEPNVEGYSQEIRSRVCHEVRHFRAGRAICDENDVEAGRNVLTLYLDVWPATSYISIRDEDLLSTAEIDEEQLMTRIREIIRLNQEVIPGAVNKMNVYNKVKMKKYYDENAKEKTLPGRRQGHAHGLYWH